MHACIGGEKMVAICNERLRLANYTISVVIMKILISCSMVAGVGFGESAAAQVPAMFAFGDSLIDVGNNNFISSFARSNYYPYGIDFRGGPSGRFTNGRTSIDMLGNLLGLPYAPAFADPNTKGNRILRGVNYASAAAGILDETGRHYGDRYSLSRQVMNFESTLNQLRTMMGGTNLTQYLAKSIAVLVFGSNDYINNYLMPFYNSSYTYSPPAFANLLLSRYATQILALHSLGLRKFMLVGIGPLGCIPNQRASGRAQPGRCVDNVNQILGSFNQGLRSLATQLNSNHPGAIFVYGNAYGAFGDILNNPLSYGFTVIDRACCGIGRNQGQITCLPFAVPCSNRNQYMFWDAFHPTEAANAVLAWRAFNGPPSDSYPINVQQMSLL
ncbi:PREDICTED: GDSL esterase/lipase At1g71250 [Fragaria vesca subsp. vesca]|uniref:GDSL esterase/lipase At1g71250 n=1 Tax=Fragaria vesca subsp. vesca TaxID=101020 RepID=UPI0002C330B3|nr:PREDICTED: GDSL esterase/lipase At1g71250 [Fragaria vesca subsp. vesca]XP_011458254.1 PREDICTED: GDSL esterase/lipase At1g71250 [Fragaria vesca subsp. vesca]XP_011458255.1 PREDICTED: GDSL esterase/lipase At1g71250 [Fragaria vesca subsp. vesca]